MTHSKDLVNGRIYIAFNPMRTAEDLISFGDRIDYVGGRSTALEVARLFNSEIIILGGKTVVPGFVDSPMHLDDLGVSLAHSKG
jgi:predicted amidohydrolase YtcJ